MEIKILCGGIEKSFYLNYFVAGNNRPRFVPYPV
jgi:hypothetical protein